MPGKSKTQNKKTPHSVRFGCSFHKTDGKKNIKRNVKLFWVGHEHKTEEDRAFLFSLLSANTQRRRQRQKITGPKE